MTDWREALFARRKLGLRPGYADLQRVLERMHPGVCEDPPFEVAQVVGTNGKGSTAAMLAEGLERWHVDGPTRVYSPTAEPRDEDRRGRGGKVGLFTSPHLHRVGERIRVAGKSVSDATIQRGTDRVTAVEHELGVSLSFFEVLTAIAVDEFVSSGCTHVVLEAGLGGRLDATTALRSSVTLITRIALEHQELLGDTIAAIAEEKAAVIRPGVPVFSQQQAAEAKAVIERVAAERGAPLTFVDPLEHGPRGLPGRHQRNNAALALAGLRCLTNDSRLAPFMLDRVRWPARLEQFMLGKAQVWFDVAHNLDGIETLLDNFRARPPRLIVFGALADKRPEQMAARLRERAPLWLVPPQSDHPMQVDAVMQPGDRAFEGVEDPALLDALDVELQREGEILICGSHYLVGALRAHLLQLGPEHVDPPGLSDPIPRG